jgi:hypothetical protein
MTILNFNIVVDFIVPFDYNHHRSVFLFFFLFLLFANKKFGNFINKVKSAQIEARGWTTNKMFPFRVKESRKQKGNKKSFA